MTAGAGKRWCWRGAMAVMATKSILDLEHPSWAIPAPLVACLLG